jgi:hypothetical protein
MQLIEQVKASLKWKKSDLYCSTKLNIPIDSYKELKKELTQEKNNKNKILEIKEDLEKGVAEVKGLSVEEPKSAEEIIKLLKIDTDKWKLSSYWNKQHKDYWLISAMITKKKSETHDVIKDVLDNFSPKQIPSSTTEHINYKFTNKCSAVLSIQDLHFGKEGNKDVVTNFKDSITNLIMRSYMSHRIEKIYYVIGGDLLNMDNFNGSTTKGTPVDNDTRAHEAYKEAFDALHWSVQYISNYCETLEVVYIPGNHDRLSSFHLAHALSKCFNDKKIVFHCEYAERKVYKWGNNMFSFEHGDVNSKNTPLIYATEFPIVWGATQYRTCYTGHWHIKKTVQYVSENEHHGFTIKHLPSLSKSDYWHYHNKFTCAKVQAIIELHDFEKGKVSEFTYNA